jgi:hypothetical protein
MISHPLNFKEGKQVSENRQRKAYTWDTLSSVEPVDVIHLNNSDPDDVIKEGYC